MIYTKHYFIDPVTNEVFDKGGMGPNGKAHPAIPNLNVIFGFVDDNGADYFISEVEPAVDVNLFPGVEVINFNTVVEITQVEFNKIRDKRIVELFDLVQECKKQVIDLWWHHSEITTSMTIKVEESKRAVQAASEEDARVVAPFVAMEADARKISVVSLAQKILSNYEGLIGSEAIITGHRGLLSDQMNEIPFVDNSIQTINDSFDNIRNFDITEGFSPILVAVGLPPLPENNNPF